MTPAMKSIARLSGALCLLSIVSASTAQNIAVVNGRPIPKARADLFIQELQKQGQAVTPELAALVRQELVDRALAQLPAHQRVPLVLFRFEAMPYDEIARKLGVSLAKVKTDILRARAALAVILRRSDTAHEKFSP